MPSSRRHSFRVGRLSPPPPIFQDPLSLRLQSIEDPNVELWNSNGSDEAFAVRMKAESRDRRRYRKTQIRDLAVLPTFDVADGQLPGAIRTTADRVYGIAFFGKAECCGREITNGLLRLGIRRY